MQIRDEVSLRKPGFTPGTRIVLWDGQEWSFPMPSVSYRRGADGEVETRSTLGPAFDAAGRAIDEATTTKRLAMALIDLAEAMLLKNYDLDHQAITDLLVVCVDDPENQAVWAKITRAAIGLPPGDETTPGGQEAA